MTSLALDALDLLEFEKFRTLFDNQHLQRSQVWKRAQRVGASSPLSIAHAQTLLDTAAGYTPTALAATLTSQNIDPTLASYQSTSARKSVYYLQECQNLVLDFAIMALDFTSHTAEYALSIQRCENVLVRNLTLVDFPGSGLYVGASTNITIENSCLSGLAKAGIVIGDSSHHIAIVSNKIANCGGAGIFVGETCLHLAIERNTICNGSGKSNWCAGIVLTDRHGTDLASTVDTIYGPDSYWAVQVPIFDRDAIVGSCRILDNNISENLASGIYIDGSVGNLIARNKLLGNSKEGICLDYGATRNIFCFNTVEDNGNRFGKTDEDLAKDFVLHHGRCADGTPSAKVPGISLDNALLNFVSHNFFLGNYGSGIKCVRTSFLNVISYNVLTNNNKGENENNHFFGIELGAAGSDCPINPDAPTELDFTPSCSNLIYRNLISGHHFSGLFFDKGTCDNNVFDNAIYNSTHWSMEAVDAATENSTLNNFSTHASRNIGLSIPVVTILGLGQMCK